MANIIYKQGDISGETLIYKQNTFASFNPSVSPDSFYLGLGGALFK